MKKKQTAVVREKLNALEDEVRREVFRGSRKTGVEGWGGAGIVFTSRKPRLSGGKSFYPDPLYVVTPFADEAGWLLDRLRDLFGNSGLIDSCSKTEFFGRLAGAALRYQKSAKAGETAILLLAAMIAEAKVMIAEMEQGKFKRLMAAGGREIADDLKRAEN